MFEKSPTSGIKKFLPVTRGGLWPLVLPGIICLIALISLLIHTECEMEWSCLGTSVSGGYIMMALALFFAPSIMLAWILDVQTLPVAIAILVLAWIVLGVLFQFVQSRITKNQKWMATSVLLFIGFVLYVIMQSLSDSEGVLYENYMFLFGFVSSVHIIYSWLAVMVGEWVWKKLRKAKS